MAENAGRTESEPSVRLRTRLTSVGRHNLLILPFVVLVRGPVLAPFAVAQWIGEKGMAVADSLPGLQQGPWFEKAEPPQ